MREHRIHLSAAQEAFAAETVRRPFHRDEEGRSQAGPEPLSAVHKPTVPPPVRAAIVKTCAIDR
jgi:hypothetical protein